jgi:hypothetical protein
MGGHLAASVAEINAPVAGGVLKKVSKRHAILTIWKPFAFRAF